MDDQQPQSEEPEQLDPSHSAITVYDVRPYLTERGSVELDLACTRLQWARTQQALLDERTRSAELQTALVELQLAQQGPDADD